jgi:hypothetical protein
MQCPGFEESKTLSFDLANVLKDKNDIREIKTERIPRKTAKLNACHAFGTALLFKMKFKTPLYILVFAHKWYCTRSKIPQ